MTAPKSAAGKPRQREMQVTRKPDLLFVLLVAFGIGVVVTLLLPLAANDTVAAPARITGRRYYPGLMSWCCCSWQWCRAVSVTTNSAEHPSRRTAPAVLPFFSALHGPIPPVTPSTPAGAVIKPAAHTEAPAQRSPGHQWQENNIQPGCGTALRLRSGSGIPEAVGYQLTVLAHAAKTRVLSGSITGRNSRLPAVRHSAPRAVVSTSPALAR